MKILKEEFKDYTDDAAWLTEMGFIAVRQADPTAASQCFTAAMVIAPDHSLPVLGLGIIQLFDLNIVGARKIFKDVLVHEPDNNMAKTMLGIANLYSATEEGLKEGGDLIEESLSATNNEELKKLGQHSRALLKEIREKMKDLHPLESADQPLLKRLKH